jgi:hypothetical protein
MQPPAKQHTFADKDLVTIGGDVPDPTGQSSARGAQCSYDLERTKYGEPKILYRDRSGQQFLLTADVYKYEGAPLEMLLFCPRCSQKGAMHTLRITQDKKHIEYDPNHNPQVAWGQGGRLIPLGGRLSVERFMCSHELDATKGVSVIASANLCRWQVVIENNIARDA